jgi:deoxyribose-phosphate aldolase
MLQLVDYTRLDEKDTIIDMYTWLQFAKTIPNLATLCVYPKWIHLAKSVTDLPITTVVNFPFGNHTNEQVLKETKFAISQGVSEIDIVWNYNGVSCLERVDPILTCLYGIKNSGINSIKIIIETAHFQNNDLQKCVFEIINSIIEWQKINVDFLLPNIFIKTSTGRYQKGGCTITAVKEILDALAKISMKIGIKMSGGIKSEEMKMYLEICTRKLNDMKYIRFGSSHLDLNVIGSNPKLFNGIPPYGNTSN